MTNKAFALRVLAFAGALLLGGLISLGLGQDSNWDLKNYHIYNAWAFLGDRLRVDLFPAGIQSYFSPLLDIPYYLIALVWLPDSPRLVAFLAGLPYGVLLFAGFLISLSLIRDMRISGLAKMALAVLATAFGASGVASVSQTGTTFNEVQVAVLVLSGVLLALHAGRWAEQGGHAGFLRALFFSGSVLGAAAGLKLTACIYAPGAFFGILAMSRGGRKGIAGAAVFCLGWLTLFVLVWGWWGWGLFELTGNPMFPMFNSTFKSPWVGLGAGMDTRFLPKGIWQAILYPFYWLKEGRSVMEPVFADPRFAMTMAGGALALAVGYSRSLRKGGRNGAAQVAMECRFLVVFFLVGYVLWEAVFSILRYAVTLEVLLGPVLLICMRTVLKRLDDQEWVKYSLSALSLLLLVAASLTVYPQWGRVDYGDAVIKISDAEVRDNSVVVILGNPIAYAAPFIAGAGENVTFVGLTDYVLSSADYGLGHRVRRILESHSGPFYVLARKETLGALGLLSHFDLALRDACQIVRSNLDGEIFLCPLTKGI